MPLPIPNRSFVLMLRALCAGTVIAASTVAQTQWSRISTPNEPPPRARSAVAFDANNRLMQFGGLRIGPPYAVADTWLFDGTNWTQVTTGSAPSARQWASAAYDRRRQRVVVFGGMHETTATFPWIALSDTWEWDGAAWHQRTPQTVPPPRAKAGFAYDEARGRIVMFGGYAFVNTSTVVNLDDTWEWDGTDWHLVSPAVRPSQRADAKLFYDPVRGRTIMTGGVFDLGTGNSVYLTGTWEWDGTAWTRLSPALDPVSTIGESVVYDDARRRAVRIQGWPSIQVFEWDGTNWGPRAPVGARPLDRVDVNVAFDRVTRRTIMFGGRLVVPPYTLVGETWSYAPTHPADLQVFGAGCPGSAGLPRLDSEELPWSGGPFAGAISRVPPASPAVLYLGASRTSYGGFALPLDLTAIGASGCTLLVALDFGVGLAPANGVAPWTVPIPRVAALHGRSIFLQGALLDLAANALGITVSNAATATIGGR